jgi:integrase
LSEAKKVESLVLAQLLEHNRLPGSQKIPTMAEFSKRFFEWLGSLPTDRPPKQGTRRYYHIGWKLLEKTTIAGRRLDQIERHHVAALAVGSSPANTNNALRTLRRMLKQAQEWGLIHTVPKIRLVEEVGREVMLEPWMEANLLVVMEVERTPNSKHSPQSANYGWQPLRDVLLIMLDTGMRPAEVFRMEWEHVKWDRGLIFVPRSKSRKSKRYVPLSERVKAALLLRAKDSVFVFPSARSRSGHIETVQKQFDRAKKLAGLPDAVVLYCARHRFSTDAMDGTGNLMAVMDAMGHSRPDVLRLYQHPGLKQIGMAINKRNQAVQ